MKGTSCNSMDGCEIEEIMERGTMARPKKGSELDNVTITPVFNGYIIKSTSTGASVFVFNDLDKAFEFIRSRLKPTGEQEKFIKSI